MPYDVGRYEEGKRVGTWMTFDAKGKLRRTREHGAARMKAAKRRSK